MIWTVGRVKEEIRSNLDDPQGTYLDDDFLLPKIQTCYEQFASELTSTNSSSSIDVREVLNLPAGIPNLADYQKAGQQLEYLVTCFRIDWKPTGNPPYYYQELEGPKDVLPDMIPQNYMTAWEMRKYIVWLAPASINVDLKIRGEFDPDALTSDESVLQLHPRIGYAVACQVSADIATVRGNKAWEASYKEKADVAMDYIEEQIVKSTQNITRRVGRQTMRKGGYVGPNSYPN